jgi:hypothetical protein
VSDAALNELVDIVTSSGNIKNGIEFLRQCAGLIESGKVARIDEAMISGVWEEVMICPIATDSEE